MHLSLCTVPKQNLQLCASHGNRVSPSCFGLQRLSFVIHKNLARVQKLSGWVPCQQQLQSVAYPKRFFFQKKQPPSFPESEPGVHTVVSPIVVEDFIPPGTQKSAFNRGNLRLVFRVCRKYVKRTSGPFQAADSECILSFGCQQPGSKANKAG